MTDRPIPSDIPDEQLWSWIDRDAPELRGHLERHPEDHARVAEIRSAMRALSPEVPTWLPERIGPYDILGRLGAGGMGIVYEARHRTLKRTVALKVIRGAWLDDVRRRRLFERESAALARLQHPAIAVVHETGETREGAPWFAMELAAGVPLNEWVRANEPSSAARLRVAIEIARGIAHAHKHGVIHRDLKPSNVHVAPDGSVKVLDFGLARVIAPDSSFSLTAMDPGQIVGTVRYMSPEQARGLVGDIGVRSDIYSFGVIVYELLTGRSPHGLEQEGFLEAARLVSEGRIVPPRDVAPELSIDLEAVLLRALQPSIAERYPSMDLFAEDLERALHGERVIAFPRNDRWKELRAVSLALGALAVRFGRLGARALRRLWRWKAWRRFAREHPIPALAVGICLLYMLTPHFWGEVLPEVLQELDFDSMSRWFQF